MREHIGRFGLPRQVLLVVAALLAGTAMASAKRLDEISYEHVASFPGLDWITLGRPIPSPDLHHVAIRTKTAQGEAIAVDGVAQKEYLRIIPRSVVWSPDSRTLVYIGATKDGMIVVRDGRETPMRPPLQERLPFSPNPTFSPDGSFMWVASDGQTNSVFVNGTQAAATGNIRYATFRGPGHDYVYLLEQPSRIVDSAYGPHDIFPTVGLPLIAKSGAYLYEAKTSTGPVLVREDKTRIAATKDWFDARAISNDGRRTLYMESVTTSTGEKTRVHVTGREPAEFSGRPPRPMRALFSPDGKHDLYSVFDGSGYRVVVDGAASTLWPNLAPESLTWSPNSDAYAYVVTDKTKSYLIRGTAKSHPYANVSATSLVFSADAKALAYVVSDVASGRAVRFRVVVNGKIGARQFDQIRTVRFLPTNGVVYIGEKGSDSSLYIGKNKVALDADVLIAESISIKPDGVIEVLTRKGTDFRIARIRPAASAL